MRQMESGGSLSTTMGDDLQAMVESSGNLVQAIAVRPAHSMRGEQEQDFSIFFIRGQIFQAFFQ